MEFKDFIIQENKAYFVQKVSDVLSAIQDLNSNLENIGAKNLVSNAQTIVNQIRRIIHTHWPQREQPNLEVLQKCGVAIMKAIEEKDDLESILKACQQQIETISGDQTVNKIAAEENS